MHRVQAFEPTLQLQKVYGDRKAMSLKIVLDSLTGATPTGALPQDTIQTFTRPSGNGSYAVAPYATPLDDTFKDTRAEINAGLTQPLSRFNTLSLGGHLSREYDFDSLGASASVAHDFNERNTTFNIGLNLEQDQFRPEGGIPIPFGAVQPVGSTQPRGDKSDTKLVIDFLAGITQVMSHNWLTQLNYSISQSSGYLTDPFKYLSLLEDGSYNLASNNAYRFESRPDSRNKQSLFWENKYHLFGDTVTASYRYFWDDWNVKAHTFDFRYRWNMNAKNYIEPHFRFYTQTEADFYKAYLLQSDIQNNIQEASADYRLAPFDATTFGIKYGHIIGKDAQWNVRIEQYQQQGSLDNIPTALQKYEIYPDMTATILQFGYSMSW